MLLTLIHYRIFCLSVNPDYYRDSLLSFSSVFFFFFFFFFISMSRHDQPLDLPFLVLISRLVP